MNILGDILSDLNPENRPFIGKKAENITRNLLTHLDLSQHTPQDILSSLRENNIMITIPTFYDIYSDVSGSTIRSQRIKYVNLQYVPNENLLEPALYPLQTTYRIVHLVRYNDLETGAEIVREFALDMNDLKSIGEMQQMAIDAIESRYPSEVIDIKTIRGYIYRPS